MRVSWSPLLHLLLCLIATNVATAAGADTTRLDIGLVVFDAGIPEDPTHNKDLGIFPRIREAEARYLPFALRQTLVDTNQWGPVRVLPDPDPGTELLITGRIIDSDGITLEVQVQAVDSRGVEWINQVYRESSSEDDYQTQRANGERPFQELYDRVAADIYAVASQLSSAEIEKINQLSLLRYAVELAPAAFGSYYTRSEEGRYRLLRLPAHDDPMLERIKRVREQEYVFIDTVDEQYATLFSNMAPTYDLWRQYNREQSLYQDAHEERLAERSKKRRGSYQAMKQIYNNYRWSKIQEQEAARLATGFNNEVEPTIMRLQGRVIELEGSLEDQYREWRKILHSIYLLETGAAG
ncbi:MAG: hypothetical protein O7F73_14900 [Gammaproteobacteria bacterium]|nr:hypothetical protein [Gammaproteobacteria bacterium]